MKNRINLQRLALYSRFTLIILSIFLASACNQRTSRVFMSTYDEIDWNKVGYYDAMFHTHPGLGDEEYDPHQTIDRYHEEGYKILTLAGHDYSLPRNHMSTIYPWTELSEIYEKIKHVQNPTEDNRTYEEIASEPYEDRDPVELGMIAIEGCEVTSPHHVISLFNSYIGGADNEDETFSNIENLGGIAYFAHPGRYVERQGLNEKWYIDHYMKYDLLIGQAIFNRKDSWPDDRNFYDRIVQELGVERPIWLFGEDDMHYEKTLGWNRNVILLEEFKPGSLYSGIPEGSVMEVKKALENGHFYLWKPSAQYNKRSFNIKIIKVNKNKIELEIDKPELVKEIRWRTIVDETRETVTIARGNSVQIREIPEYSRFIRVEIEGEGGTIYLQPCYIKLRK